MFSIYLSNDNIKKVPGDISFGGYDLEKYAKKGAQIQWMDQSHNEFYWTVSSKNVNQGGKPISQNNQQITNLCVYLIFVADRRFDSRRFDPRLFKNYLIFSEL